MMDMFRNIGMNIGNVKYLSPLEAYSLSETDVVFIDIRPDYETVAKRIVVKTIVYLHWKEFEQEYHILDQNKNFIVMDEVGLHSKEIVKFMMENGFQHAASMAGGIFDWERDGLPMDIDPGELLTGSCACTMKPKKRFKK
jgi:rhodanese-related sulfurtransferase